jgi:hypothetical protein
MNLSHICKVPLDGEAFASVTDAGGLLLAVADDGVALRAHGTASSVRTSSHQRIFQALCGRWTQPPPCVPVACERVEQLGVPMAKCLSAARCLQRREIGSHNVVKAF